ncbi:hypothetical protein D8B26_007564 [Coccidioides posadasii str. Silveira]|uniref:Predicted protein n=1 Tax=Coccidioides posadasii (strain RMSCC 757 / Silveira) TaxID=443226 RepID=E9D2B2_COCPS|nr:predicted protein [Coccidioides posadasii str. Silveira]QVM12947.1 hypothetical protein D8B26_007564 [Coccidioides posadasii str. Silveira]
MCRDDWSGRTAGRRRTQVDDEQGTRGWGKPTTGRCGGRLRRVILVVRSAGEARMRWESRREKRTGDDSLVDELDHEHPQKAIKRASRLISRWTGERFTIRVENICTIQTPKLLLIADKSTDKSSSNKRSKRWKINRSSFRMTRSAILKIRKQE